VVAAAKLGFEVVGGGRPPPGIEEVGGGDGSTGGVWRCGGGAASTAGGRWATELAKKTNMVEEGREEDAVDHNHTLLRERWQERITRGGMLALTCDRAFVWAVQNDSPLWLSYIIWRFI
jgi:hypothetical protein